MKLCGENGVYLVWTETRNGFDVLGGRHLASGSPIAFPAIPEGVYSLSCSQQSSTLIVGVNGWQTPGDIHAMDLLGGAGKRLVDSNLAGIQLESLVRPESITMVARDGVELQGLLYLPLGGDQTSPPPVIFEVHGGPTAQSRASFDPVSQAHAARGIARVKPHVRGPTGFGRTCLKHDDHNARLQRCRTVRHKLACLESYSAVGA